MKKQKVCIILQIVFMFSNEDCLSILGFHKRLTTSMDAEDDD